MNYRCRLHQALRSYTNLTVVCVTMIGHNRMCVQSDDSLFVVAAHNVVDD